MLQNRVDPFGSIIRTSARGAWMGNRGVIHNQSREIVRPFKHKAWITCVLEFKGRKRNIMTHNHWTELFFLDEATAFAAGHRPCFECRREDAKRFKKFWIEGNPSYNFTMSTSINAIDDVIHNERIDVEKKKILHERLTSAIPEGTFVVFQNEPHVLANGLLHHWTPFGYDNASSMPADNNLFVLTPASIVNTFQAGYKPEVKTILH